MLVAAFIVLAGEEVLLRRTSSGVRQVWKPCGWLWAIMVFIRCAMSAGTPGISNWSIVTLDSHRPGRTMLWSAPASRTFFATSPTEASFSCTSGDLLHAAIGSAQAISRTAGLMCKAPLLCSAS